MKETLRLKLLLLIITVIVILARNSAIQASIPKTSFSAVPESNDILVTDSSFITTWKTDNPGISNTSSITIPVHPGGNYNYDVDWDNDGVFEELGVTD